MNITFRNQGEAIIWIASNATSEDHFKVLREDLQLNHLFTDEYFLHGALLSIQSTENSPVL
ncbi:MAG: hypothetical protein HKN87_24415 [Saprospiraceae bacterium]|nr:hypothetical protein [Saprospiraceae bacterium]